MPRATLPRGLPGEVYPSGDAMAPERNTHFLRQCARTLPIVNFADSSTGRIYARLEAGSLAWCDSQALAIAMTDPEARAGLLAVAPGLNTALSASPTEPRYLQRKGAHTLGVWGE